MKLIDATIAADKLSAAYNILMADLVDTFATVPAVDAVPVIRCRECKFWETYGFKGSRKAGDPLEWEGGCMKWRGGRLESDFCSCGKRKVGNNA